jgi:hypothetical protein
LLEPLTAYISIFLSGLSIKLLDDYIDDEIPHNVPYAIIFICISSALWKESASLFICSYVVGMFHDERVKLISSLKVYQEQVVFFIISIFLTGFKASISSLFIICTIQLLDDCIDMSIDSYNGKKNWALRIGRVESLIISGIFLTLSIYTAPFKTAACISASIVISYIFYLHSKKNKKE